MRITNKDLLHDGRLQKAIEASQSFRGAARKLGIPSQYQRMKRLAEQYSIDFSHFSHGKTYEQMVGEKYEMLTVLRTESVGSGRRARKFAYCVCECGNHKKVRADGLKIGQYVSCGCHSRNRWNITGNNNPAFQGVGEIRASYLREVKRSAKRRNIEYDLEPRYLWDLYEKQERKCALTGLPIYFGRVRRHQETTASLDRVRSDKSYVRGNVQWVLKDVNMMKGIYDEEYFIELCNLVANTHPSNQKGIQNESPRGNKS